jgi:hypothetical protein
VICAGGGGIPVVRDQNAQWAGVEAVIDKDLAAAQLAIAIQADAAAAAHRRGCGVCKLGHGGGPAPPAGYP